MKQITFIDTEIEPNSRRILDIGCVKQDNQGFHSTLVVEFKQFLQDSQYICGHNILNHDLKYIKPILDETGLSEVKKIDTLYLSPLLFPKVPYHALLKDDKLQTEERNNPLNDAKKAKDLFLDEISAFQELGERLKYIFYALLKDKPEFCAFFDFVDYNHDKEDIEKTIHDYFSGHICENANLSKLITDYSIELAYCLALINTNSRYSITPPWVEKNYPNVERIMFLLRNKPCLEGCNYCNEALDAQKALERFFSYPSYRTYAGEPLQERAVNVAIQNKSLLAIFPTGGGKSITFQVPALMSGENEKGLTVVISPLQSLMKDQVDNLERSGITEAVTINGLLDPIERSKSIERVENGTASIIYISPESLRSKTIEHLLLGRNVVRFVIDEAHCFSAWGQDFRVDYLYIGDFIKSFQEKKHLQEGIPVSCFTATAKVKVIEDICKYFKDKLSIEMEVLSSQATRTNLRYKVINRKSDEEKYNTVRELLENKNCPTIIYVSRTRRAMELAGRLTHDGYSASAYHGKMDKKEKSANQDAFIRGDIQIMVATSAFGMGVDKKDVGLVIHYEISDSLENYVQEAGRAGRDESISADCYVLFNDEDLSKHFILLNQTKLSIQEIQQIWRAVKDVTKFRSQISQSALEIARKAGWNDSVAEIETRVKTAIAALEDAGYLKRGQNMPRIYANSILAKNVMEAVEKINASFKFTEKQKIQAIRIIKKLFSSKSRKHETEEVAESRVDYISDHLGIVKEDVITVINLLRQEKILADTKDLTAFIKKGQRKNTPSRRLNMYYQLETFLLTQISKEEKILHMKELNEEAEACGCKNITTDKIKTVLNYWVIKNWIKRKNVPHKNNHIAVISNEEIFILKERIKKRYDLAKFILDFLFGKVKEEYDKKDSSTDDVLIEFSILELKEAFEKQISTRDEKITVKEIEDAIFYLSRIDALKVEGGFLVVYNALTIQRLELDNKIRYKVEDYKKLNKFYENKIQQIHVVGEYAHKMIEDYKAALEFVDDYFKLNGFSFINKYFKGSRKEEITKNITPAKFKQLFGELSPAQLKIINDKDSKYIVVAAGPGSGKTRILVHKLASLLLMEDVKHEQLLMVTFSRLAATEFKQRLLQLIGNAANFVEIKTFHSYCFDLLGKVGSIEKSNRIINDTIQKIQSGEVEQSKITKTVLVIDEAQDMDQHEYALIQELMKQNEQMRVIAVGDDDQNIFEFRGASSKYMTQLLNEQDAMLYELVENYRSKSNLVDFSNQFIQRLPNRLKHFPIVAIQTDNGMVQLNRYRSNHLITPVVNAILSEELTGTTCVLTKTNEEAVQVTGLLVNKGLQAKLIQSNDGFNLFNLLEVRFFITNLNLTEMSFVICKDVWENAKAALKQQYGKSSNIELCLKLIKDFEIANPKTKYRSDFEVFIRESKLEDFFVGNSESICVSTIHKAKGREFDNVFLMLDQFNCETDEGIRQLYVAMTRAKNNLFIHYNGSYLDAIIVRELQTLHQINSYALPEVIVMQLSYRDVWLDFFFRCQNAILRLNSGDELNIVKNYCCNKNGQPIAAFSRQFNIQIQRMKQNNYIPKIAKVKHIVYWEKENHNKEIRIVLPEIYFERVNTFTYKR